ncbi:UDP-glycosyltransferase family protein, partial [Trifolium medium]|nr:UDP-glycosyltransferase family protein [Trifolium medium]
MEEQHLVEQRKGFMWAKYFNFTLLKSMDEDLAEAADDGDDPRERWLWPMTGEVHWQGIYEREREERSQRQYSVSFFINRIRILNLLSQKSLRQRAKEMSLTSAVHAVHLFHDLF